MLPALNSRDCIDSRLDDKNIESLARLKELIPPNRIAIVEERFNGEMSTEYMEGLLSGYLHARDIYKECEGKIFNGWMNAIANFLAQKIVERKAK